MKIIVACEGLGVSPHAVHCASFMCYTVERGIIADCRNLPNPGLSAEDTAQMFIDLGVSTIITGRDNDEILSAVKMLISTFI